MIFTLCTTTFLAETWTLSSSMCGTVPWKRSHTCFFAFHRQYTSEEYEKSRWANPTFLDGCGTDLSYVNTGDGMPPWACAALYSPAVVVYRLCGAERLGSRVYALTATL